jgi:tight adherence protein B
MSQAAIGYLAAGAFALLLAVSAMLLLPGRTAAQLRERARSATAHPTMEQSDTTPKRSIRKTTPDSSWSLGRLAEALGHNPLLPPAYRASVLVVAASSTILGLLVFVLVRSAFGLGGSAVGGILIALALARFQFRRKTRRYTQLLFSQIPDALSLVVRSVRAGLPVGEALNNVSVESPSPTCDEFAHMMGEVSLGVPLDTALWSLHERTVVREYAFLAVTLGLQSQAGGSLAETLENLVDMVRRRVAMVGKARALSAEARTSSAILAGMPFATALVLAVVSPDYVGDLFTDPRGKNFLIAFAVLLSCGMLSLRWLLQRATED